MPREISQHTVFVAGAEDVDHLIVSTLRLIAGLDKVLCPTFGMSLRGVRGLGVAPAGWGRPQDRINPLVRSCDLFMGIVSRQFGHPTGVAVSGTIEEFDIVADLRRLTGRTPEILLFFRQLPEAQDQEVSRDLQLIREFRRRIAEELLWVDFDDDEHFKELCVEQLIAYVLSKGAFVKDPVEAVVDQTPQIRAPGPETPAAKCTNDGGNEDGSIR